MSGGGDKKSQIPPRFKPKKMMRGPGGVECRKYGFVEYICGDYTPHSIWKRSYLFLLKQPYDFTLEFFSFDVNRPTCIPDDTVFFCTINEPLETPDFYPKHTFMINYDERVAHVIKTKDDEDLNSWLTAIRKCKAEPVRAFPPDKLKHPRLAVVEELTPCAHYGKGPGHSGHSSLVVEGSLNKPAVDQSGISTNEPVVQIPTAPAASSSISTQEIEQIRNEQFSEQDGRHSIEELWEVDLRAILSDRVRIQETMELSSRNLRKKRQRISFESTGRPTFTKHHTPHSYVYLCRLVLYHIYEPPCTFVL